MTSNIKNNVETILKLLEQVTSKGVVTNFLKEKGLNYSGTWQELFEKRIYPAVKQGQITLVELTNLLALSEETGRQHIFLYKLPKAVFKDLSKEAIEKSIKTSKLEHLINQPLVIDKPDKQTISEIRWNKDGSFVIKAISKRTRYEYIGDDMSVSDGILSKRYQVIESRTVSLLKLHTSGLVEVRISSKSNTSKYHEDVEEFLRLINNIVPMSKILSNPILLTKCKDKLWSDRVKLSNVLRFSDATLRNSLGTSLRAATGGRDSDLLDDTSANQSMNTFTGNDVNCETNNIFFKMIENKPIPSKEIHVLMSGEINEFTVTAYCQESDYYYVLNNLIKFNG